MPGRQHRRFRTPDPQGELRSEDIEAFVNDLEATINAFREQSPGEPAAPPAAVPPSPSPAAGDLAPAPAPRPVAAAPARRPAAAPGGLLDELRAAAALQQLSAERLRDHRQESDAALAAAMRRLWDYLNEFVRHLNTLKPAVPQRYRIAHGAEVSELEWHDSFIDFRTTSSSELAAIESIALSYTLDAPGTIAIERVPQQAAGFQHDLDTLHLRYAVEEIKTENGKIDRVVFNVERRIKINVQIRAEFDAGRIVIRGRNFNGFGPAIYALAADAVTPALLDDLGRFILGRPNQLLASLTPIRLHER